MNIPQEIIDASKMDGCSEFGTLRRVVVPLSRPVIITATIIAFVFSWNNFLWPLIVTNPSHYVLTTGIANLSHSSFGTEWNIVLAGAMITLLPPDPDLRGFPAAHHPVDPVDPGPLTRPILRPRTKYSQTGKYSKAWQLSHRTPKRVRQENREEEARI